MWQLPPPLLKKKFVMKKIWTLSSAGYLVRVVF